MHLGDDFSAQSSVCGTNESPAAAVHCELNFHFSLPSPISGLIELQQMTFTSCYCGSGYISTTSLMIFLSWC